MTAIFSFHRSKNGDSSSQDRRVVGHSFRTDGHRRLQDDHVSGGGWQETNLQIQPKHRHKQHTVPCG